MAKERLHPKSIKDKVWHYCPGCSHGIVHRIIGERPIIKFDWLNHGGNLHSEKKENDSRDHQL